MAGNGSLALIGGEEFDEACRPVDEVLLEMAGTDEVLVIPTAAAFENPRKVVDRATEHFRELGATVSSVMVFHHAEADDEEAVAAVRDAPLLYLTGGSPMHLRAVLLDSKLWEAILDAYGRGAVLAASGSGAVVLCNPMIDPRGGAYTVGLGLVANLTVFPHRDTAPHHLWERAVDLRPDDTVLVGIDEHTALIHQGSEWRVEGPGGVEVRSSEHTVRVDSGPVTGLPG